MKSTWTVTFDHAAIAIEDPTKLSRVLELIGLKSAGSELVASQGVKTHFLKARTGETCVEVLETVDPEGVIAKYLKKRGPGIHHLSFQVEGKSALDAVCELLTQNGVRLVYSKSQLGAHGTRVNFIHPESTGGILIEISEKAS